MNILSIDVGIKNCAYVLLNIDENNNFNIKKWEVINFIENTEYKANTVDFITLGKILNTEFIDHFKDMEKDITVLIENQIGQNAIRMKGLQSMISQWFVMNEFENIKYISSSHKLNSVINDMSDEDKAKIPKKMSYSNKKKLSKILMTNILKDNDCINNWEDHYSKSKKKDDLSDCFLQGYYYIKKDNLIQIKNNLIINCYDLKL